MIEQIPTLLLGWLLGLLAPAIVERIKNYRDTEATTATIKSELNETAYRMVLGGYSVSMHLGTVDRAYLKWVLDSILLYQGSEPTESIVESINAKLALSEEKLTSYTAAEAGQGVQAIVLPKVAVPFVDARVTAVQSMANNIQLQLFSIRSDVRLIDDLVDQSRIYFQLTFGKVEGHHYAAVVDNLRGVYYQYEKRCRMTADRIHKLQVVI